MNITQKLADEFQLTPEQIDRTIALLDDGKTIPFIARYRKEVTGSLDDQVLRTLDTRLQYLRKLEQRKNEIISAIHAQQKLTPELSAQIEAAQTLVEAEDLYLPFRPKRKTRASAAIARGLEPLAHQIMTQQPGTDPEQAAAAFVDTEKDVTDIATALQGAKDILAEEMANDADVRKQLRRLCQMTGSIESHATDPEAETPYQNYYDYSEPIRKIAGHRVLALDRGEREGEVVAAERDHRDRGLGLPEGVGRDDLTA